MKKEKVIEMINANGRKANLLIECEELPIIGLTSRGRSGQMEIDVTINLKEFASEIEALGEDEVFAIGRDINCDFCPRLKEFISKMYGVAPSKEQLTEGEELYIRIYRTISRVHVYVEKTATGFKIYNCSLAGTIIIPPLTSNQNQAPTHVQPQAQTPAHVQPQAQASEEPQKKESWWKKFRKIF